MLQPLQNHVFNHWNLWLCNTNVTHSYINWNRWSRKLVKIDNKWRKKKIKGITKWTFFSLLKWNCNNKKNCGNCWLMYNCQKKSSPLVWIYFSRENWWVFELKFHQKINWFYFFLILFSVRIFRQIMNGRMVLCSTNQ